MWLSGDPGLTAMPVPTVHLDGFLPFGAAYLDTSRVVRCSKP